MPFQAREPLTIRSSAATPLADALTSISRSVSSSFHALPLSSGRSLHGSGFKKKYDEIFGDEYLKCDMTVTGQNFDSFFFGEAVIHESEKMTASLFGATGSLYVTAGTTMSNQIALDALYDKGMRVLLDKNCHQSMHFGLHRLRADVEYLHASWNCKHSEKSAWSLNQLLAISLEAQQAGRPFDLMILNAHSYDGVVYDIPGVIEYLLSHGVVTRTFLIDEAWGAANYFHSDLMKLTAMAAGRLLKDYPDLNIVATHSAHKSLSCLRQASMLHYCGDPDLGVRLKLSRFRLHTTSPSYPILASMDLARAQMQDEGTVLMARASELAAHLRREIKTTLRGSDITLNEATVEPVPIAYAHADPTKVSINVSGLGLSAAEVKETLFQKHGIYVNRITEASLLLNFHIGVDSHAVEELLKALHDLSKAPKPWQRMDCSEKFIIPYPPGVPLVVPGDAITPAIQKQIRDIQRSGAYVFYA